jgi:dipeptidyl aminopeptidase/acylaminoacyl peptidase
MSLYEEAEAIYRSMRQPGTGQISDAREVHRSPSGTHAVFAGTIVEGMVGAFPTRICRVDLKSGATQVLTFGPNTDRLPKYSPDGRAIAFLSDRHRGGDFQLNLLDPVAGAVRATPFVAGWVEYLHWSPDGRSILLGVAGHGADLSGGQGAITSKQVEQDVPSWLPSIDTGREDYRWRRVWIYDLTTNRVSQITHADLNVWEAAWCGNEAIAAVASRGPEEGLWYSATLHIIETDTGNSREILKPQVQLGWPAASPAGTHLAIVEALCSDRWCVAGDLRLIDVPSGEVRAVNTHEVDITCAEWCSEQQLLLAGHRGFETVIALYDAVSGSFREVWKSEEITVAGRYASVSGFVLVGESFLRAPEIAVIRDGRYHTVKSFDLSAGEHAKGVRAVTQVTWKAPDDLDMQGLLLLPEGKGPHPLIMHIHGGPVYHWRQGWLGRGRAAVLMLLRRGYAVFFPNPRGSAGRGQAFARHVQGDMGGADTFDLLSGLDHLIACGLADPKRLGVTGISYGGFMTCWLITQDSRFAAAVPVAPVTNHVTEHLLSNIPHFTATFLPGGKYFQRSPVMHAHKARTPTLNICGALDRCTPPEEAMQFHHALLENGVKSVLVTYPEEGHGIVKFPAAIDYAARVVGWFEEHMAQGNPD